MLRTNGESFQIPNKFFLIENNICNRFFNNNRESENDSKNKNNNTKHDGVDIIQEQVQEQ